MPGGPEVVVILLVALIVLGPDQLPKAMRTLGQALAEIRKVSSGFQSEMRNVMDTIDSTAKEAVDPKPGSSTPSSSTSGDSASSSGGHVEEVTARNDGRDSSDVNNGNDSATAASGTDGPPPSTSGPSASDRAAG